MNEDQALLFRELAGARISVVVSVAVQDDLAAQRGNCLDLDGWRRDRHDDDGTNAAALRRECHTLGMIAGRAADHAVAELLRGQVCNLVVGTAQLERKDRLQVFALHQDRIAQSP